ncbi:hypothetical protein D0869_14755 [Hortaea werneckii]|uniref:L-dopachrome isomerase n=1 Tax=Hortaea werneckii TaxID=91943 RepID=A0A3M6W1M1_HORWE|nr:hypothetical protein KC324_g9823 [Hortaea werneckii]KAI7578926.1 hypothetical protein KC316_g9658 [Hortaea werneckii]RMX72301.1 hypothetical protein D0869_14755 [Hortaea werneckii]RMY13880.1 hypothetical protein D0868_01761 [Hortaea werneckii]
MPPPPPNATAFQTKSTSGPTLAGTTLSARDSRIDLLSQQHRDSWKRASNSSGDTSANPLLSGSKSIDDFAAARKSAHRSSMSHQYNTAGKHRSQYYEDQFRYKDSEAGSVRDKVQRESPVVAELKTNVIIKDEYTLVTDLSYHLAQRYTRPDSSIMIKVDHSACLALGGTFDPCYILNVTTVPSSMGPSINKRNAALIQSFMADILSVPSDRGIVKFTPIEEVNYAMNGTTMHGEIERLEKHQAENGGVGHAVRRAVTNANRRSLTSSTSNGVPPKLDTDVKTPSSAITPNGVSASDHDDDAKRQKRKSMTTTPPPSSAIPNVFELAATESNDRPSTAHGTPYAAENGLRMNGISKEDLVGSAARAPNGRPKTFAGSSASPDHTAHDPMPSSHQHQQQPQRPSATHQRNSSYRKSVAGETAPSSTTTTARRSGNIPISPKPDRTSKAPTETGPPKSPGPRSSAASPLPKRDTYLDNISSHTTDPTTTTSSTSASKSTKRETSTPIDPKLDAKASERSRHQSQQESKDTAANTAKRRSTVTATPKIPPPPPVPQDSGRKSGGGGAGKEQQRVGKRKSFLSAFRRSAAA